MFQMWRLSKRRPERKIKFRMTNVRARKAELIYVSHYFLRHFGLFPIDKISATALNFFAPQGGKKN